MRLEKKLALVTGGTGGIGAAICRRFAAEGSRVIIADINEDAGRRLEAELRSAGQAADFALMDVASPEDVRQTFAWIADAYGHLDVLVNGAMCANDDILRNRWDPIIDVGFKGTHQCCEAALPLMRPRGGSIVNISSVNALGGFGDVHLYSGTKAAVIGYSRSLAVSVAPLGVRVNLICPGTIETAAWDTLKAQDPALLERIRGKYPVGRVGRPEDVANAALFLASAESEFVTGAVLVVDGGLTAGLAGFLA